MNIHDRYLLQVVKMMHLNKLTIKTDFYFINILYLEFCLNLMFCVAVWLFIGLFEQLKPDTYQIEPESK